MINESHYLVHDLINVCLSLEGLSSHALHATNYAHSNDKAIAQLYHAFFLVFDILNIEIVDVTSFIPENIELCINFTSINSSI